MLADSDLNFHKKLMRFEYSRLYFHDSNFFAKFAKICCRKNLDYTVIANHAHLAYVPNIDQAGGTAVYSYIYMHPYSAEYSTMHFII